MSYRVANGATFSGYTIRRCSVTGQITLTKSGYAGGIAGSAYTVEDCYSTCAVTDYTSVDSCSLGGIAGSLDHVRRCYATGNVKGNGDVGLVGGYIAGSPDASCYWYSGATRTVDGRPARPLPAGRL